MSKNLESILSDTLREKMISDEEHEALARELRSMREELTLNRQMVGKLLDNLNSVSAKLASRVVQQIEGINVAKTLNPKFYEVSIAPQTLRLKLPFDTSELWDTEVIDQMADALSDEIATLFLNKDKRVHFSKTVKQGEPEVPSLPDS